jgi:hypothetical protein
VVQKYEKSRAGIDLVSFHVSNRGFGAKIYFHSYHLPNTFVVLLSQSFRDISMYFFTGSPGKRYNNSMKQS